MFCVLVTIVIYSVLVRLTLVQTPEVPSLQFGFGYE